METNEEAKQEAIKKAYGEDYERLKAGINEDGIFVGDTEYLSDELFYLWDFIANAMPLGKGKLIAGNRPKSIRAIKDNNGWIRIEPDGSNLPKDTAILYDVCYDGKPQGYKCSFSKLMDTWGRYNPQYKANYQFTHYKPIEQEKEPIY